MSMKELVGELAKESARTVLPFPVAAVFAYLINEVVKDKGEIERVEQKLAKLQQVVEQQQRLIEQQMLNHYNTGIIYLSEAQNAVGTESQKGYVHEYLHDAQKEFTEATLIELPEYPLIPIKGHFYVGVCHDLSQDKAGALSWYEKAHDAVVTYIKSVRPAPFDISELPKLEHQLGQLDAMKSMPEQYLRLRHNSNWMLPIKDYNVYASSHDRIVIEGYTFRVREVSLLRSSPLDRDPVVYDYVTGTNVHLTQLMGRERDWIANRINEIKNYVEPIDYLLAPDDFDPQVREPYLSKLQEVGYFENWKLSSEEALDAVTWAVSLTYLIASRGRKVLGSPQ